MTTLWDTTGSAVVKALGAERRKAGSVTSSLVLTLVVVVDEGDVEAAAKAATTAGAEHPCRVLVVVRRRPDAPEPRLDAEVLVGGEAIGPGESVVMRMQGRLALHAESVVLPLLAPDAPVVTWWYGVPPERLETDPLGVLAERRVTDAGQAADAMASLKQRATDFAPGDTDLAWPRATGWRKLLASVFDSVTGTPTGASVHAAPNSPSAALLAGWLSTRLELQTELIDSDGPDITAAEVTLTDPDGGECVVQVARGSGAMATLSRTGQPDRHLPLPPRDTGDLLAEELRRLDASEPFAEALGAWFGTPGLADRESRRRHVWLEPVLAEPSDAH